MKFTFSCVQFVTTEQKKLKSNVKKQSLHTRIETVVIAEVTIDLEPRVSLQLDSFLRSKHLLMEESIESSRKINPNWT